MQCRVKLCAADYLHIPTSHTPIWTKAVYATDYNSVCGLFQIQ